MAVGLSKVEETPDWISVKITYGRFPSWLAGNLYRIGPGKFECDRDDVIPTDDTVSEYELVDFPPRKPRVRASHGNITTNLNTNLEPKNSVRSASLRLSPQDHPPKSPLMIRRDSGLVSSPSCSGSNPSIPTDNTPTSLNQRWHVKHWFDGLALLHQFRLEDGQVKYRSRYVCESFEQKAGMPNQGGEHFLSFGPKDPCTSMFKKVHTAFQRIGKLLEGHTNATLATNVNVTVCPTFPIGNESLVLRTDANVLQSIDPATLLPKRMFTYADITMAQKGDGNVVNIPGFISAAHGLVDPDSGEYFNFTMEFKPKTTGARCHVFSLKARPAKETFSPGSGDKVVLPDATLICSFDMERASYMHSFSVTKDYVVLTAYPYHYNSFAMLYYGNAMDALRFEPNLPTLVYVIPRNNNNPSSSKVPMILEMPAFFCFHHINAWQTHVEETGTTSIHLDLVGYKDIKIVEQLLLANLRKSHDREPMAETFIRRIRINLVKDPPTALLKATLTFEDLVDAKDGSNFSLELPRIRNSMRCRPYRYVYGISCYGGEFSSSLVKIDVRNRSQVLWYKAGHYPGEPIFVPREDTKGLRGEDDGVLLSVVLDAAKKSSYLLLLDARDMQEIAKAELTQVIPFGFHGNFQSDVNSSEYLD